MKLTEAGVIHYCELSIPLNGFKTRLSGVTRRGNVQLSIPLNGFAQLDPEVQHVLHETLSIPLNGFDTSGLDPLISGYQTLSIPLNGFRARSPGEGTQASQIPFNSIEWIPSNFLRAVATSSTTDLFQFH